MNHLKMHSLNKIDENVSKIAQLFPNCVTEAKDENGEITYKIDFDMLKQELSSTIVDGREERYQFTWPDKKKSVLLANAPISKTLRPCREESVDFDNTENLYIEGDNLEVLKLLQETYLGKIKMIYIDPPYNTGNDFVYEDDFRTESLEFREKSGNFDEEGNQLVDNYTRNTESNGRFHTDWLNMMYPRLKLARDLLTDDGVIFISIDDNEQENLKKVCNEILGGQNFVAQLVWERAYAPKNDAKFISNSHDYVLIFAKNINSFVIGRLPRTEEANARYSNPDNDPRGVWKPSDMSVKTYNEACDYSITTPSGRVIEPPAGRCWRLSKKAFLERLQDNRIYFGADGNSVPCMKRFLTELKYDGMAPTSIMFYKDVGHSQEGAKEVTALMDAGVFDGPKPVRLLLRLLTLANLEDDSIVLDFFSGSATIAQALMQFNVEKDKHCKFILVQVPENTDEKGTAYKAGYKNICEIGKERIRRAGRKLVESHQLSVGSCKGGKDGKLQRSSSLAEVNGNGQGDLFSGEKAAEGRDLCTVGSDEASCGVDSVEHSGRTGTKLEERICTVSENSERLQVGTGNSTADLQGNRLSDGNRNSEGNESSFGNRKNDNISNENSYNSQLKTGNYKLDVGFRVLKCDTSNMEDVYYTPEHIDKSTLFKDNIKSDRTGEDLLFQTMLDLGIMLSSKIETRKVNGKEVFCVEGNYLMACFDKDVTEDVITEIAKQKPYYFVMRDPADAQDGDSLITNFEQIFTTYSSDTVRKVL